MPKIKNRIKSKSSSAQKVLKDLNSAQLKAATHDQGPLLIIAGAGTGKTTVVTRRLSWLILSGKAKPEEILAVTFTEKAAGEMEERIDQLLPYGYLDLWVSTFHSFCERILQDHGLEIGLPVNFKLLDSIQQAFLVRENFEKFDLDYYKPLGNPTRFIRELIQHFSRAKDEMITPEDYLKQAEELKSSKDTTMSGEILDRESRRIAEVARAFQTYQQLLLDNHGLDFGDLINYTIQLFEKRPHILEKYRQQFKYILVDEFQDTNSAQYYLLKLLAAPKNNLTVVSDDDQAIYRWRGASYNNVLQFQKDFKESNLVSLTKNYRSFQNILDLSYKFIQLNNPARLEAQSKDIIKKLQAVNKGKAEIEHYHLETYEDENKKVIEKILELKKSNPDSTWDDFAILVRANKQAEIFCQGLQRKGIPFQYLAHRGLFSKPLIMDILAYLKLLDNYHESTAVYRILTSPIFANQISNQDLIKLNAWSKRKSWSLYETMRKATMMPGLSSSTLKSCNQFLAWIEKHTQMAKIEPVSKIIYAFLHDTGYLKTITGLAEKGSLQGTENVNWLNQFLKQIDSFEANNLDSSINHFTNLIQMMLEAGETGELSPENQGPEAVKILTIHSAKGLEFNWVFIVNLVDKRFPTIERSESIPLPKELIKEVIPKGDVHIQEERRLFYVAMTRAKKALYFTSAQDYGGKTKKKLSRFLLELEIADKQAEAESLGNKKLFFQKDLERVQKESMDLILPKWLSFSQLAGFQTCPLQYKFNFLLRIPHKGKAVFSFGSAIHNTLDKFTKKWLEKAQGLEQVSLFEQGKEKKNNKENKKDIGIKEENLVSLDELLEIYQQSWIDEWFDSAEHQKEYYLKGKQILKDFYRDFIKNTPKIKCSEASFKLKIQDFMLKGKIDRIDEIKDGLEIIDYKTGKAKEKLSTDDKFQLLIYQLAAKQVFPGEKIAKLSYYYLNEGKKLSFIGDEKDLEKIEEKVQRLGEQIQKSEFLAKPGMMCRYCDFKDICEHRQI